MTTTPTRDFDAVRDRLVAVETKLDIVLGQVTGVHQDHETRLRALESRADTVAMVRENTARIRALERFRWVVTGAAATGGGALGALVAQLLGASP